MTAATPAVRFVRWGAFSLGTLLGVKSMLWPARLPEYRPAPAQAETEISFSSDDKTLDIESPQFDIEKLLAKLDPQNASSGKSGVKAHH